MPPWLGHLTPTHQLTSNTCARAGTQTIHIHRLRWCMRIWSRRGMVRRVITTQTNSVEDHIPKVCHSKPCLQQKSTRFHHQFRPGNGRPVMSMACFRVHSTTVTPVRNSRNVQWQHTYRCLGQQALHKHVYHCKLPTLSTSHSSARSQSKCTKSTRGRQNQHNSRYNISQQ